MCSSENCTLKITSQETRGELREDTHFLGENRATLAFLGGLPCFSYF